MRAPLSGLFLLRSAPAVANDGDSGDGSGNAAEVDIADHHSARVDRGLHSGRPALRSAATGASSLARTTGLHAGEAARQRWGWVPDFPMAEPRRKPAAAADCAAQPAGSDRPLPINLATALYLSNARPLVIASAEASVQEAAAQLQSPSPLASGPQCRHRLLPSRRHGPVHRRHGHYRQQAVLCGGRRSDAQLRRDRRHFQAAGGPPGIGGPGVGPADRAERCLVGGGGGLFRRAAGAWQPGWRLDAVGRAEVLVRKTTGLAQGLVPQIEVDRASALVRFAAGSHRARANWRITSSRLAQILRLNPGRGRSDGAAASSDHLDLAPIWGRGLDSGWFGEPAGIGLAGAGPSEPRARAAGTAPSLDSQRHRGGRKRTRQRVDRRRLWRRNGHRPATLWGPLRHGRGSRLDAQQPWRETDRWSANGSLNSSRSRSKWPVPRNHVAQEVVQAHAQLEAAAARSRAPRPR